MGWVHQLLVVGLDNAVGATVLAGVVYVVTRWWRNPLAAHALWLLVLVKLVAPPVVPLHWGMSSASLLPTARVDEPQSPEEPMRVAGRAVVDDTRVEAPVATAAPPIQAPPAVDTLRLPAGAASPSPELVAEPSVANAASSIARRAVDEAPIARQWSWPLAALGLWLAGSAAYLALATTRIVRFHRALGRVPLADERVARLAAVAATRMGYNGALVARVSRGNTAPSLWAVGRPTILLPQELAASLADDELTGILAHEIAHLVRHDPWVRWFELSVVALYWWHPVAWWARRELRDAEERACDALVLDRLGTGPEAYVRGLLRALDVSSDSAGPCLASGLGSKGTLQRRVEAMLARRYGSRLSWTAAVAVGMVALAFVPLSMRANPVQDTASAAATPEAANAEQAKAPAEQPPADGPDVAKATKPPLDPRLGPGAWVDPQVRAYLRNYMLRPEWGEANVVIKGRVVDQRGEPVADADVAAQTQLFGTIAVTRSDARGEFVVRLASGGYPEHPALIARHGPKVGLYQIPAVDTDRPPQPYLVVLEQPRDIKVKVVDSQGQPVADATAIVMYGERLTELATTDRQGAASLQIPRSAPINFVMARKDGLGMAYRVFDERESASREPQPFVLTLVGARTVRVRALDGRTGQPLAGVMVSPGVVQEREGGGGTALPDMAESWKITGSDGIAEFAHAPKEQSIFVRVRALDEKLHTRSLYDNQNTFTAHVTLDPQRDGDGATLEFWPQLTIVGQVRFPDGRPAAQMPVRISDRGQTTTDETGHFQAKVFSNDYYLLVAGDKQWVSPPQSIVVGHEPPPPIELVLGPAIRVFGTDPDYRRLRLQQLPDISYAGLPRKDLLPLRLTERLPGPVIERTADTDADGRFEFFVGPGKYALLGPRDETVEYLPAFTLSDQKELEVSLQDRRRTVTLKGRVVRRDDPQVGVADAMIYLESDGRGGPPIRANGVGEFTVSISDDVFPIVARAPGGLLGIFERRQGSNEIVIPVGSSAKVHGRLVRGSGGAGGSVDYAIVQEKRGNWSANSIARGSATLDDQGFFTLGVVPGWTYALWAGLENKPNETLPNGTPIIRSIGSPRWLGTARSDGGETMELGDIAIEP